MVFAGASRRYFYALKRRRIAVPLLLLLVPFFLLASQPGFPGQPVTMDGGDCEALGSPRRPSWARPSVMRKALLPFLLDYKRRPVRNNAGGMRLDHSFALWFTLHSLNPPPAFVVESGAFRGLSTWIIATCLPNATIFSLDPGRPERRLPGVVYLTNDSFTDFKAVDWAARGVDPSRALVFFDDHQSGFRRVYREGAKMGFRRFIAEDNYPFPAGDSMSLKWVCERSRRELWPGSVRDNFGREVYSQTWAEHVALGDEMRERTKVYYEFPPIANETLSGQNRFDSRHTSRAIMQDRADYERLFWSVPQDELNMYTHFSYIELHH